MKNVSIFVPVAPFEPLSIIIKSVESLARLDKTGLILDIIYIVDCPGGHDGRTGYLNNENISHIVRLDTRGRRGGAINDGIRGIRKNNGEIDADFVAFFDVDSRPDPDFLLKCLGALENDDNAVIASGARYITNRNSSPVAQIIAAEYSFFEDVYRLFEKFDGFKQFNGLIGMLDARMLDNMELNEDVYCEDLDFTQRIYIMGKKPVLADTRVGEQAPTTVKELYNQRVRWLSGALEGLGDNLVSFPAAPVSLNLKLAWFTSLTLPFVSFLLMPFVPVYGAVLKLKGHDSVIQKTLGLMFHVWLITFCGAVAVYNQISKRKTEWTDSSRTNI